MQNTKDLGRMNSREDWLDATKLFACSLVALGHLFQSFAKTGLVLPDNRWFLGFNSIIYQFHVPVFFFCSGYLYQRPLKFATTLSRRVELSKKALNLAIPYFLFSGIALTLKHIFQSEVATPQSYGWLETLFLHPLPPYWFLYTLLLLFAAVPRMGALRDSILLLGVALLLKLSAPLFPPGTVFAITSITNHTIWFVLGMFVSRFGIIPSIPRPITLLSLGYIPLTITLFVLRIQSHILTIVLSFLGVSMTTLVIHTLSSSANGITRPVGWLAKYTMHVFLLHTIFAAGIRSILFKFGVHSIEIHLVAGLSASFVFPIIVGMACEKITLLGIAFQPTKAWADWKKGRSLNVS